MIILEESTFSNPGLNHRYIISDDRFQAYGYIPHGTTRPVLFKKPKKFSCKGRKLKEITDVDA